MIRTGYSVIAAVIIVVCAASPGRAEPGAAYPWLDRPATAGTIADRFAPPAGYRRIAAAPGSFAHWLRHLPLKPPGATVFLHNRRPKPLQSVHAAVVDIDTGRRDLQQCADIIMRLRAEYLFARGALDGIHFNFTSGDRADFKRWTAGWRPVVRGNNVSWRQNGARAADHRALRAFLKVVFIYAGTYSLRKEMRAVGDPADIRIGDAFIEGGFPGHAVLVVDMAENPRTGRKVFMLAQGYTPAQDFHVLKNPNQLDAGVWYDADIGDRLNTPEWRFRAADLRRFR